MAKKDREKELQEKIESIVEQQESLNQQIQGMQQQLNKLERKKLMLQGSLQEAMRKDKP